MSLAAVALGSNLGAREQALSMAIQALGALGTVTAVSSFVDTEPVGYLNQPRFLNAAALLDTPLSPVDLLHALLRIEQEHGRDRSHGIRKGPRTLDLDLLLYDDVVLTTDELVLPHPELHHRSFVLQPLVEIAPAWLHPTRHLSMAALLQALPPTA
ncbi:MAG: 2-amino-4-hydroxy-6-hydroxymethyldihydropteridine diphosphokinase [Janthinobacterium lividum]